MPRLFTALEIPPRVAGDLAALRGGLPGARWIDAENYHITLRFVGDVDDSLGHDVALTLAAIRRPSLSVTLEELSSFGGDKPRAIVVKARADSALADLQAEQERLLRRIGVPPEPRKFVPHVTLARLRGASCSAVATYLGTRGYFPPMRFDAARFVLFSSRDSVGGGPYIVEAGYPLRDRSAQAAGPGELAAHGR
jgi:2'-5' RNA ligase